MSYQAPDIYANGSVSPQQNSQPVISHANRGYLLYLFIIISSATTITAAACIMSLMFLLVGAVSSDEPLSASIVVHVAIQVYEMITLIGIVVVEMEWTEAIRNMSILQSWGVRGLSYSFVGLLVFQELGAFEVTENSVRYPYLEISSIILICLGAVYSVMVRTENNLNNLNSCMIYSI